MPQIELRKISEIIPYEFNNRIHPESQVNTIANSINEFGFTNPILVDEKGFILAGHGRFAAALKLDLDRVPVIEIKHLNETQKKAYRILDNKTTLDSQWDLDSIAIELSTLAEEDFDLEKFGLDELSWVNDSQDLEEINPTIAQNNLLFRVRCESDEEFSALKSEFATTQREITFTEFMTWLNER